MTGVQHFRAVKHHNEVITSRSDVKPMPLAHHYRRLVFALQMPRKAARVIGIVVAFSPVERLIAGGRVADLQLIANLMRVAILAPAAQEDAAVDVGRTGAELHLELE